MELGKTISLQYKLLLVQGRSRRFCSVDAEETEVATSFELFTQIKLMYKQVGACPTSKERVFSLYGFPHEKFICLSIYGLINYFCINFKSVKK